MQSHILMQKMSKPKKYYSWKRTLSYNALFYWLITERGLGKTFGFLIYRMLATYWNDEKCILATKFKNELQGKMAYQKEIFKTMNEILVDEEVIKKEYFKDLDIDLVLDGNLIYLNGKVCFGFYAINNAIKDKKITALKTYDAIAHDEFLSLGGYCQNEVDKLMTMYDTVDRRKNTTKLFMLGNALTRYNPYFEQLGIPNDVIGYHYIKERRMLVHISNDEAYQIERLESAITKLAGKDSKYSRMANKTEFVYDNDDYVMELKKSEIGQHRFGLIINTKSYTFSAIDGGFYIHSLVNIPKRFHNKKPSRTSKAISNRLLKQLRDLYFNGMLFFTNIDVKMNFLKDYIKE